MVIAICLNIYNSIKFNMPPSKSKTKYSITTLLKVTFLVVPATVVVVITAVVMLVVVLVVVLGVDITPTI